MMPVDSPPLGMMMILLSAVAMMVLKICISRTVPLWPCASIKSPTLKGLKSRIITPPAKFCSVPLNAIPMATPAEAKRAMNELVSMPRIPIIIMTNRKLSVMFNRLLVNEKSDASTCFFSMIFTTIRMSFLISQRPMKKTIMAINNFEPSDTLRSVSLVINTSSDNEDNFSIVRLRLNDLVHPGHEITKNAGITEGNSKNDAKQLNINVVIV